MEISLLKFFQDGQKRYDQLDKINRLRKYRSKNRRMNAVII